MIRDADKWAEEIFGDCELGDARRTNRLISLASSCAKDVDASILGSCNGNEAQIEGAYRFLRNEFIDPEEIRNGGYQSTVRLAAKESTLLAIEDTTTLSYSHQASRELGYTSNSNSAKTKGFQVHSVLMLSEETTRCIGLAEQTWYCRDNSEYGKRAYRKMRNYQEKESYWWEHASKQISEQFGNKMDDVISVCDREADIYEYLSYKLENNQRFIVRARVNRLITSTGNKLFEEVLETPCVGTYKLQIHQKGSRKAREALIEYRATSVEIIVPKTHSSKGYPATLSLNVVAATERPGNAAQEKLEWIILTTQKIKTPQSIRQVIRNYELRWRIEDYHKAWKSGAGVENLRLQSKENLERGGSILAFIAVRLLQLREIALECIKKKDLKIPVTQLMSKEEWQVLWATTEKTKLPRKKRIYYGLTKKLQSLVVGMIVSVQA